MMDVGIRQLMPLYEEYCNIDRKELDKIIEDLVLVGNPNIVFPEEIKNALCRNNL